ncbi:MAG: hypothetical protein LBR41_01530 [Rickettsiales bacterium]|jgi:hypothetical protein|nr:hypothetical protein [Rickettsiales bacterium]
MVYKEILERIQNSMVCNHLSRDDTRPVNRGKFFETVVLRGFGKKDSRIDVFRFDSSAGQPLEIMFYVTAQGAGRQSRFTAIIGDECECFVGKRALDLYNEALWRHIEQQRDNRTVTRAANRMAKPMES